MMLRFLILTLIFTSLKTIASDSAHLSFITIIGNRIDKQLYFSNSQSTIVNLSNDLLVGRSYYIETHGRSAIDRCGGTQNYNLVMEPPQFIILTYTGPGQTMEISGSCSGYSVYTQLEVGGTSRQITTGTSASTAYTVFIKRVIQLK